jgi:hypothetical protein
MAMKALREVGECGCCEYQAATRMRELVRSLQEEVRNAHRVIEELTRSGDCRKRRRPSDYLDASSTWKEPVWIRPS